MQNTTEYRLQHSRTLREIELSFLKANVIASVCRILDQPHAGDAARSEVIDRAVFDFEAWRGLVTLCVTG